tara:strand:+ start:643 stop:942 length:300 start_codon:yes stop_codon:yes gene_type:complete
MKLLTQEIENKIPKLYETDGQEDKIVYAKFFNPIGSWTWYAIEYDSEEKLFYGAVDGDFFEFGYFSLEELETIELPFGMKIERDIHFKPKPLSEIQLKK